MKQENTHPEGMPEATNLAPLSGCEPIFMHGPVVALCLPPANFLNRFAVNHKKHHENQQTANSDSERTRAHDLSMNRNFVHSFVQIRLCISCVEVTQPNEGQPHETHGKKATDSLNAPRTCRSPESRKRVIHGRVRYICVSAIEPTDCD